MALLDSETCWKLHKSIINTGDDRCNRWRSSLAPWSGVRHIDANQHYFLLPEPFHRGIIKLPKMLEHLRLTADKETDDMILSSEFNIQFERYVGEILRALI